MQLSLFKRRISWLLSAGVVLLIVTLVAVCLGLILSGAGDVNGAQAVRGLTWVALSMLVLDVLALTAHLAVAVVLLIDRTSSNGGSSHTPSDSDSKSST
ncbi:MAG: hypothetical protein O3B13_20685 [Planctomycetota bacterium]|nr:hypothetical protein [Planctomycetota bacterium]